MNTISEYTATIEILEFDRTVTAETGTVDGTLSITSHGLVTGDFIVNKTRRTDNQLLAERGSRKVTKVDADTLTISPVISNQTSGDVISLFTFNDKTEFLLDGTLSINVKAEGKSEASFVFKSN